MADDSVLFYSKGQSYIFKPVAIRGANSTVTIWAPATSMRIVLTGLDVATGGSGTIRFTLGNLAGDLVAEYYLSSASISPRFGGIESTVYDRSLFAAVSSALGDGWRVTAYGFEIS